MGQENYKDSIKKSKERIKSGIVIIVRDILIKYLETNYISNDNKNIIISWYNNDSYYINKNIIPNIINFNELLFIIFKFFIKTKKYTSELMNKKVIEKSNINDSLEGKIYHIITGNKPTLCKNNNTLRFNDYGNGFNKLCSRNCLCVNEKRKKTNLERYGVDNPSKSKEIIDKTKQSNIEKYGVDNPSKSEEVKNKIKQTNQERYGVDSTLELREIQDRIKQTTIEKYGVDHNFKSKKIRNNIKEVFIDRYGVDNPFKSKEVKNKIKQTSMDKYGVDNPSKSKEIIDKIKKSHTDRYGTFFNRKHISKENIDILEDKDKLVYNITLYGINILSKNMNCDKTTIYRYIKKHGILYDKNRSSYEIEIENWLIEQKISFQSNSRSIISPLELDFYLSDYNIAIEFNGLYWHSDLFKNKNYHLDKYLTCKEKGIRLISINEDIWIKNSNLIKSKILNIIGKSEKGLPARKLFVCSIDNRTANQFCEKYHIQGKTGRQMIYSCGAFDKENNLIGIMIFNEQRKTGEVELIRFCTDGKIHCGLFSKMLKFSINENNFNKIISFADLRYSEGNLYEKTGFKKLCQIKPDYMYIRDDKSFHKNNFSKSSLKKKKLFISDDYVNKHTEKELTEELGYHKLYDIGKIKYELYNSK